MCTTEGKTTMSEAVIPDAERRAVGKFLRRMLPILVLMLLVNQMDRTYGLGAGLFFIGYALFEVPSNMLLERFGARVWLTRIMITWGAVIVAMCFIHNVWMFYGLRFLLGVAEAGFFPGVLLYFTQWLPDSSRGRASAVFLGGSATAYIVTLDVRARRAAVDRRRLHRRLLPRLPHRGGPLAHPGGEGRARRGRRP
jgi:hypothetical protein